MSALFDDNPKQPPKPAEPGIWTVPLFMPRILWQLAFAPAQYEALKQQSPRRIKQASRWLAITLAWLPILISAIGGATYNMPFTYDSNDLRTLLLYAVTGWVAMLILSNFDNPLFIFAASGISFCLGIAVLFGMSIGIFYSVLVAFVVLSIFGMMDDVVEGVAIGTIFGITLAAVLNVTIHIFVGWLLAMMLVIMLALSYAVGFSIARLMERARKSGQMAAITRALFILMLVGYAVLIWYALLGGYKAFTFRS